VIVLGRNQGRKGDLERRKKAEARVHSLRFKNDVQLLAQRLRGAPRAARGFISEKAANREVARARPKGGGFKGRKIIKILISTEPKPFKKKGSYRHAAELSASSNSKKQHTDDLEKRCIVYGD